MVCHARLDSLQLKLFRGYLITLYGSSFYEAQSSDDVLQQYKYHFINPLVVVTKNVKFHTVCWYFIAILEGIEIWSHIIEIAWLF